jgi:hypothetical protein
MSRYKGSDLTLLAYQTLVSHFSCVGMLEDVEGFIHQLDCTLGLKAVHKMPVLNVGKNKESSDRKEVEDALAELNREEILLYRLIKEHLETFGRWKIAD